MVLYVENRRIKQHIHVRPSLLNGLL